MSVQHSIEAKIRAEFAPTHLEVVNESFMHSVPPGSESHFRLVIVSERFAGASRVARHQMVNRVLAHELQNGLHALSLSTHSAAEWQARGGRVPDSPPCLGGGKGAR